MIDNTELPRGQRPAVIAEFHFWTGRYKLAYNGLSKSQISEGRN